MAGQNIDYTVHKIEVYGRVQGVYYRASTRAKANELGLDGMVRNRRDGSVEIIAGGPPDQLHKLENWCHEGPPKALVERVVVSELKGKELEKGFTIDR